MPSLQWYFTGENTEVALAEYRRFAVDRGWPVKDKVRLYRLCGEAFNHELPYNVRFQHFESIYNELLSKWHIFRNAVSYQPAKQVYDALAALPESCRRESALTLASYRPDLHIGLLQQCIEDLYEVKRLKRRPTSIMAISKFLHLYNPRLFPVFDGEVVRETVLRSFRAEWLAFHEAPRTADLYVDVRDYLKYIAWANSVLQQRDSEFMSCFANWLSMQLTHERSDEPLPPNCQDWFAPAFEFMAVGAMYAEKQGTETSLSSPSNYARGMEFPNEGFVQQAIERYFTSRGYLIENSGFADLCCRHPVTHERWVVEAKGETKEIGLDFRTGLGQLIQRMDDPVTHYAIATPDIPQYRKQCERVQIWVRQALHLYWLFVTEEGDVMQSPPEHN
ncbi:MAG: hypothetical protein ACYDBB_04940 [Armatimonadota bacterium]